MITARLNLALGALNIALAVHALCEFGRLHGGNLFGLAAGVICIGIYFLRARSCFPELR